MDAPDLNALSSEITLDVSKVYEPRLNLCQDYPYYIQEGGMSNIYKKYQASSASNSEIGWSYNSEGVRVAFDSSPREEITMIVYCSDGLGGKIPVNTSALNSLAGGLRQYPFNSIINSTQITLNGAQITFDQRNVIQALLSYGNSAKNRQLSMSYTATKPDILQTYDSNVSPLSDTRNPFGKYTVAGYEDNRNLADWCQVLPGGTDLKITVSEPIFQMPFNYEKKYHPYFFGIYNFGVQHQLGNLYRFLSGQMSAFVNNPNAVFPTGSAANLVVEVPPPSISQQFIRINYINPHSSFEIPPASLHECNQIQRFTQTLVTLNPGQSANVNLSTIEYKGVPLDELIFVKPTDSQGPGSGLQGANIISQPDCYCRIDNYNLFVDGAGPLFSTFDSRDLWRMSTRNGLQDSWLSWSKYKGSILRYRYGQDVPLNPNRASGTGGSFAVGAEMNITDLRPPGVNNGYNQSPIEYTVYRIPLFSGYLKREVKNMVFSLNPLSEQGVVALGVPQKDPAIGLDGEHHALSSVASGGKLNMQAVLRGIRKALPLLSQVGTHVKDLVSMRGDPAPSPAGSGKMTKRQLANRC